MPIRIEKPGPTVKQINGTDLQGIQVLSVIQRVTYLRQPNGSLERAPEQTPLVDEPLADDNRHLLADCDLFPLKPKTDVVILGHAYGRGRSQFDVSIHVNEKLTKRIRAIGDRSCASLGDGKILFSPPAPVDKIPLSYKYAYGGTDTIAEAASAHFWVSFPKERNLEAAEKSLLNPFCYPRNPIGRGYIMDLTTDAVNQLTLPNLEDPLDLLTPDRLAVGRPGEWFKMPLPQATEWVYHNWFPRFAHLGIHIGMNEEPKNLAEVERGYSPPNIWQLRRPTPEDAFAFTCGASLGLQLPHFRGGEVIRLENMHPKEPRVEYRLPKEQPKIWIDGRKGTMKQTEPVIQSVIIEPDIDRVSVIWRGSASAIRPYMPEELQKMPLRVEWA